jgi:acyl carrier protein
MLADDDLAGHDGALGFSPGGKATACYQEGVQALFGRFQKGNNGLHPRAFQSINLLPAMASHELKESIKDMMVENLMLRTPREEIADDLPLFGPEGLGLDSIDALELVVSLEKHFGVTVPNSDVARNALATVETIGDYVEAQRAKS